MLRDPDLKRIAAKHGISVVQTILRWHLQYGDVAIPKSLNPERQRQNLDLTAFELDDQDMADIAAMDNPEGRTFGQNPPLARRSLIPFLAPLSEGSARVNRRNQRCNALL